MLNRKLLLSEMRIFCFEDDEVKKLWCNENISDTNMIEAMCINHELNNLGYTLKPNDILHLARLENASMRKIFIESFRELLGDVKAKPMYPNFPSQVMEMDEATYRFHQVLHYFSTYGVEMFTGIKVSKGWLPYVEDTEKTESDNQLLDLKVIDIMATESAVNYVIETFLKKAERLTIPEMELLSGCIEYNVDTFNHYNHNNEDRLDFKSFVLVNTDIKFKENLYDIFKMVVDSNEFDNNIKLEALRSICQHTGDVLKCIKYYLESKDRWHLKTTQKRLFVKLLESYPIADFEANLILSNKNAELNKILIKYIDYNTYSRSINHKNAVKKLRSNELQSWEGKAKYLISNKAKDTMEFISQRPGMMLRMLTLLYRNNIPLADIKKAVLSTADKMSGQTLITLLNHYSASDPKNFKGEPHNHAEVEFMHDILLCAFNKYIDSKNIDCLKDKKVYLDFENYDLKHSIIECNEKSQDGGYIRSGLAYKIPDSVDRIRFFVYWNDKRRVDIDLHSYLFDNDMNANHIGWNGRYKTDLACMSGDITHSDAAEYIDVAISNNNEIAGAVFNIDIFSGAHSFKDIDEVFVGMMAVSNIGTDIKLYDPKNCFFTHYLKNDFKHINYGYLSVKNRYLKFIGKHGKISLPNPYEKSKSYNLIDYISQLIISNNCNIVSDKDEADVILTMEKSTDEKAISLLDNNFFLD